MAVGAGLHSGAWGGGGVWARACDRGVPVVPYLQGRGLKTSGVPEAEFASWVWVGGRMRGLLV